MNLSHGTAKNKLHPLKSHTVASTYKQFQLATHLKYNTSDHNPELQQQVVSCWVECRQVDKSQVVIQAVEESRNKVQHHNCQKGKYCHKMLFIQSENYCLNENSDPIPSRQLSDISIFVCNAMSVNSLTFTTCTNKRHPYFVVPQTMVVISK